MHARHSVAALQRAESGIAVEPRVHRGSEPRSTSGFSAAVESRVDCVPTFPVSAKNPQFFRKKWLPRAPPSKSSRCRPWAVASAVSLAVVHSCQVPAVSRTHTLP